MSTLLNELLLFIHSLPVVLVVLVLDKMYKNFHRSAFVDSVRLLLARLLVQYCFARRCLSSVVVVCNAAGGRAGRRARVQSAAAGPGARAVGRPTVHGGLERLHPVKPGPHQQQCRSNRQQVVSCFDRVASTLLLVWTGL